MMPRAGRAAEKIDNFVTQIRINSDVSLLVSETWHYDFDATRSEGVAKTIPLILRGDKGDYRVTLSDFVVSDETGIVIEPELKYEGNNVVISLKPPKGFFVGKKTFNVSYKVLNAIQPGENWDVLIWPVIGNWPVAIAEASAQINLPANVPQEQLNVLCQYGQPSDLKDCGVNFQDLGGGLTAQYIAPATLYAGEGFIITLKLPKKVLAFLSRTQETINFVALNWPVVSPVIFLLFGLLWRARRKGGLEGRQAYNLTLKPPDDLAPLEIAALSKKSLDRYDLANEIFWLAAKGYLAVQIDYSRGAGDYVLVKKRQYLSMPNDFDRLILDSLFASQDTAYVSDWQKQLSYLMPALTDSVMASLSDKGYVRKHYVPYLITNLIVSVIITAGGWYLSNRFVPGVATEISTTACGPIYLLFALSFLGKTKMWIIAQEEIRGFSNYLRSGGVTQQGARIVGDQQLFEDYLAYASILSLSNNWLNQFTGVPFAPPVWFSDPSWINQVQYDPHMLLESMDLFSKIINSETAMK
ncbi:MAG: DUF2207 domain-containing protein [Candidatus Falkowbacteria bacterium]